MAGHCWFERPLLGAYLDGETAGGPGGVLSGEAETLRLTALDTGT
ncbi:hypothetical protein AB0E75_04515 [Streptomyces griseoviridis]|uniref:Uncharacterized protein n=1 Tax=Streptomyces griseoviridis TaxID=45398 RepID=A0A918GMD2_STRGD|nr:hypothetical protein [Streptomyces niveoruber]GGS46445.1 hypothetical protein GCM10010238_40260 [Streptomyces niveoruber]